MTEVIRLGATRHDLEDFVNAIKTAVYEHGTGFSMTEAIGAIELAKLEIYQEALQRV